MTATIRSHELAEVARWLNALAALDGSQANLELDASEVTLVIEHRRSLILRKLEGKGISVLRVKIDEPQESNDEPLPLPST